MPITLSQSTVERTAPQLVGRDFQDALRYRSAETYATNTFINCPFVNKKPALKEGNLSMEHHTVYRECAPDICFLAGGGGGGGWVAAESEMRGKVKQGLAVLLLARRGLRIYNNGHHPVE